MKRFLSLLLVVVLLLSLAVPAFANEPVVGSAPVAPAPAVGDVVDVDLSAPAIVEPVEGGLNEPALNEPIEGDFTATAPAMGELAAVAADSTMSPAILSNIPPNTPVEYTVDGVKHSFYYTIVLSSSSSTGFLLSWVLDGSLVNYTSYGYGGGNGYGGSDFKFNVNLKKINDFYVCYFGYSHINNKTGVYTEFFDIYNTSEYISIPSNAVFLGIDNPNPDLGGGDKTNGFVGEYGAKILLPRNGFKQSKLNTIATKIYYKIPYNGVMTDVKISVGGYIGDRQDVTLHKVQELSGKTVLEGYLDVAGAVSWNKTTPITFTITDYNGKSYTCAVDVTCYDDFIDTDNDGLDDRTNQDDWTGNPDFNKPIYPDNSPPEGANVVEWFKWFFSQIGQFFDTLKSGFDSVVGYGADFSRFLGSAFSYLPSEISVIIGLGFTALVFLRIFGR